MKRFIAILFALSILKANAQQITYASEKEKLYNRLTQRYIGPVYDAEIKQFYNVTCDSLINAGVRVDNEPIQSILTKYFQACLLELGKQTITVLRIPNTNANFLKVLETYKRAPLGEVFRNVGINRTRLLASAFKGTPVGDTIRVFADIWEMMYSPILIPGRITKPQYTQYRDTMLHYLANMEPELYLSELKTNPVIQDLTLRSKNETVKAVSALQDEEQTVELLPFGLAFREGRTSREAVKKLIPKPAAYYTAFVNELLFLYNSDDELRHNYLQMYVGDLNSVLCEHYVEPINELHEQPDAVRYKILNGISATDLYFVILGGESMFYTSSFVHVFNRFLKATEKEGLTNFFDRIGYYGFGDFLTIVSGYGMLGKLSQQLDEEKFANTLVRYMKKNMKASDADRELILRGMGLSEVFNSIKSNEKLRNLLVQKIDEIRAAEPRSNVMIHRMYNGFKDILLSLDESKLKEVEKLYEVLPMERLKNRDTIVQAALFYDDVDGAASFANYIQLFPDTKWQKEDRGNYLVLRSRQGNAVLVYCNKPNTKVKDNAAQNEMLQAIADANLEITTFLHRGHSYHLYKSLRKLPTSAQFVYLGSCGGYNDVSKVFHANPDAHIISTRNIGSKYVNDPIINTINAEMLANKDLDWNQLWKVFGTSITNKNAKDLFSSYIPPNKYIGIMFIREVFNY